MKYKFFITSKKAWDAMLESIKNAQKYIFLEMYIFVDGIETNNFFEALKERARSGVKVKIVIDSFGSRELNSKMIEELKNTGIELLFFSYFLKHTHKKILIVDGKVAYLGGVNIHKLFKKWNDLQLRITGPMVKQIARSFARTYQMCRGKDVFVLDYLSKKTFLGKSKLWFLEHGQLGEKSRIKSRYKKSIGRAKEKITIVSPYFAPRRWLIGALHQAILRGVNVEIILPQKSDGKIIDRVNYYYIIKFYPLGIKFYLQEEMIHAKAMIVDNKEGIVGSQNIDLLSFDYLLEAGMFFTDQKMVSDLNQIIQNWKNNSTMFNLKMYKKTWLDRIIAPVIRIFQSII
jgi:cardiolipin synthase